jgi:hypothetical protein
MGKVVELGARARLECATRICRQTDLDNVRPGLNLLFTSVAGVNGKGARPAFRLALDGHFPREQKIDRDLSEHEP